MMEDNSKIKNNENPDKVHGTAIFQKLVPLIFLFFLVCVSVCVNSCFPEEIYALYFCKNVFFFFGVQVTN